MTKKGFTLVELIVVSGILSIIMLSISQPIVSIIKYQRESQITDSLKDNIQFVINKMEKELKTSSNVYVNDAGELNFKNQQGVFIKYKLEEDKIKRKQNDEPYKDFTDSNVFKVNKSKFIVSDKENLSKLITIYIEAESLNLSNPDIVSMQTSVLPVNDKPIIKDGLTVYLDPGNTNSYSGLSGSRWISLVNPASTDGTILNGVSHSKNDSGYFAFSGTNQGYFTTTTPSISGLTNYSTSIWINMDVVTKNKDTRFFWHGEYAAMMMKYSDGVSNSLVSYIRNSVNVDEPRAGFSFTDNLYNEWNNLIITYDGSKSKLYLNGSMISEVNFTGQIKNQQSNKLWLGGLPGVGNGFYTKSKISQVLIYDRALTPSEIKYNYDVTKGRFSIQ